MLEIQPIPGNRVVDGTNIPLDAYRLSHAVLRWNIAHPDELATVEVYANKDDAEPPINSRDAEPGEVYTRTSTPAVSAVVIRDLQYELSYIDTPPAS